MKLSKTMKNSLKSSVVLIIIASVAVLLLALCNQFFPKYVPKLDFNTVKNLNSIVPAGEGVSVQNALDEKYYQIDTEFDLDAFNKKEGDANNKVLAIYKAVKGDYAGAYIFETQTMGYSGSMILLTAYDTGGKICGFMCTKNSDDYILSDEIAYENLKKALIGQSSMTASQIKSYAHAHTNATSSASGIAKGLTLSGNLFQKLSEGGGK